jgi:hypothetical protein
MATMSDSSAGPEISYDHIQDFCLQISSKSAREIGNALCACLKKLIVILDDELFKLPPTQLFPKRPLAKERSRMDCNEVLSPVTAGQSFLAPETGWQGDDRHHRRHDV